MGHEFKDGDCVICYDPVEKVCADRSEQTCKCSYCDGCFRSYVNTCKQGAFLRCAYCRVPWVHGYIKPDTVPLTGYPGFDRLIQFGLRGDGPPNDPVSIYGSSFASRLPPVSDAFN